MDPAALWLQPQLFVSGEREREGPPGRERGRARSDTTAADGLQELGASCWLEMRLPSSVSYIAPLSLPQRAAA